MDNVKNDNYYIQKIIKDLEELNVNEILLDSMLYMKR